MPDLEDERVEAVAEALWVDAGGTPSGGEGRYPWDREPGFVKKRWRRSARAAIAALSSSQGSSESEGS